MQCANFFHILASTDTLTYIDEVFSRDGERRAAGLKDKLSEPVSTLLHHSKRTLVFPPLGH